MNMKLKITFKIYWVRFGLVAATLKIHVIFSSTILISWMKEILFSKKLLILIVVFYMKLILLYLRNFYLIIRSTLMKSISKFYLQVSSLFWDLKDLMNLCLFLDNWNLLKMKEYLYLSVSVAFSLLFFLLVRFFAFPRYERYAIKPGDCVCVFL